MAIKASASAQEITDFANNAKQRHQDLVEHIRSVQTLEEQTTATWSGQARAAFDQFMERYYLQAGKLNDKLAQTADNLLTSAKQYDTHDQDFHAKVNAQASSLDLPAI